MEDKTKSTRRALRRYALFSAMALAASYGCASTASNSQSKAPSSSQSKAPVYSLSSSKTSTLSTVQRPIDDVASKTKAVLDDNGVVIQDRLSEKGGHHQLFKGTANGLDVTVSLDREGPKVTKMDVTARTKLVDWDHDFAKKIHDQIAAKAS